MADNDELMSFLMTTSSAMPAARMSTSSGMPAAPSVMVESRVSSEDSQPQTPPPKTWLMRRASSTSMGCTPGNRGFDYVGRAAEALVASPPSTQKPAETPGTLNSEIDAVAAQLDTQLKLEKAKKGEKSTGKTKQAKTKEATAGSTETRKKAPAADKKKKKIAVKELPVVEETEPEKIPDEDPAEEGEEEEPEQDPEEPDAKEEASNPKKRKLARKDPVLENHEPYNLNEKIGPTPTSRCLET